MRPACGAGGPQKTKLYPHSGPSTCPMFAPRVARAAVKTQLYLHSVPSTRRMSAKGCLCSSENVTLPFRAFDAHKFRTGSRFRLMPFVPPSAPCGKSISNGANYRTTLTWTVSQRLDARSTEEVPRSNGGKLRTNVNQKRNCFA